MDRKFWDKTFLRLKRIWKLLGIVPKILISALFITCLAVLVFFWPKSSPYTSLLTLDKLQSHEVRQIQTYLDNSQIPYQISQDHLLLVPKESEGEVRLALMTLGLPKPVGNPGYNVFDGNTWIKGEKELQILEIRALKGQLENDLTSFENIRSAHVILDLAPARTLNSHMTSKASIILDLIPGTRLGSSEIQAITHHVAGAVRGLEPNMVAISDTSGHLYKAMNPDGDMDLVRTSETTFEEHVKSKIEPFLANLFGYQNFYVTVQAGFSRSHVDEERKIFSGNVEGVNLGIPVPVNIVESTKKDQIPTTSWLSLANPKEENENEAEISRQMAVPVSHVKSSTSPGALESLSIGVVINRKALPKDAMGRAEENKIKQEVESQLINLLRGYHVQPNQAVTIVDFHTPSPPKVSVLVENEPPANSLINYMDLRVAFILLVFLISVGIFYWAMKKKPPKDHSLEDILEVLQERIDKDPKGTAQVMRNWMHDDLKRDSK